MNFLPVPLEQNLPSDDFSLLFIVYTSQVSDSVKHHQTNKHISETVRSTEYLLWYYRFEYFKGIQWEKTAFKTDMNLQMWYFNSCEISFVVQYILFKTAIYYNYILNRKLLYRNEQQNLRYQNVCNHIFRQIKVLDNVKIEN
jgi:hypothetical protein